MKALLLETLLNSKSCKIFHSTYFERHLRMADSENIHEIEDSLKLLIRDFNYT